MNLPTWVLVSSFVIASMAALFSFIWNSDQDFYEVAEFKKFNDAMKRGK
jgi:hypothetical protein